MVGVLLPEDNWGPFPFMETRKRENNIGWLVLGSVFPKTLSHIQQQQIRERIRLSPAYSSSPSISVKTTLFKIHSWTLFKIHSKRNPFLEALWIWGLSFFSMYSPPRLLSFSSLKGKLANQFSSQMGEVEPQKVRSLPRTRISWPGRDWPSSCRSCPSTICCFRLLVSIQQRKKTQHLPSIL